MITAPDLSGDKFLFRDFATGAAGKGMGRSGLSMVKPEHDTETAAARGQANPLVSNYGLGRER